MTRRAPIAALALGLLSTLVFVGCGDDAGGSKADAAGARDAAPTGADAGPATTPDARPADAARPDAGPADGIPAPAGPTDGSPADALTADGPPADGSPATDGAATDAVPALGTFTAAPCPDVAPAFTVRCGTLTLPAARPPVPGGPTVSLFVMVAKSTGATPAADPVVYLSGGPGESASAFLVELLGVPGAGPLGPLLARRDVVAIDQRGTGRSLPSLQCPELLDEPIAGMGPMMMAMMPNALVVRCHDRLVSQGIDLGQYRTTVIADDFAEARVALGYQSWNLLGLSYGTRLGLELMRRHPEGLRSVTLDSVLAADVDLLGEFAPNMMRALTVLAGRCAEQEDCARAYPDLLGVFLEVVRRLDGEPHVVANPRGEIRLTGQVLALLVSNFLYSAPLVRELPEIIFQLRDRNFAFFDAVLGMLGAGGEAPLSWGQHYSVQCADAFPFSTRAQAAMLAADLPEELRRAFTPDAYFDTCPAWNVPPSPPAYAQAVASDVPTLLLSGQHDPVTPPAWSERAAATLSHAARFVLPAASHGVLLDRCGASLIAAFVDDPSQPPPATCVTEAAPLAINVQR